MNYLVVFPADKAQEQVLYNAYKSYIMGIGWPLGEQNKVLGQNRLHLSAGKEEEEMRKAIGRLRGGDDLVVPNLYYLSTRPSMQQRLVTEMAGKGVNLHVLSLKGPLGNHIVGVAEAWLSAKQFEVEQDAKAKHIAAREARIQEEQEAFRKETVHQMVDMFGAEGLMAKLDKRIGA